MTGSPAGSQLSPGTRTQALRRMASTRYDVLVLGGGVTGAGVALDAATRGLSVALVEMRDYAAGTSGRSGKLIHGGLRYLEQRDFGLVREALRERALMLRTLCPHLVRPLRFLYPLRHRIWERAYVGAGLLLYDTIGGAGAVPRHRHLSRRGVRALAPGLDTGQLAGAITFYDVQIDDSRHTMELVRTAAAYGADVAAAAKAVRLRTDGGRVTGATVRDLLTGDEFEVLAGHVVSATGVWTDAVTRMTGQPAGFTVQASKGVHIMVPRSRIDLRLSMFVRATDSVLFVRSWRDHWLIGTTDTPWRQDPDDPTATAADIAYLLDNVNRVVRRKLTTADVDGVFAGLRPLRRGRASTTSRLSREHAVESPVPGLITVTGGKYTTYRVMAADAVDLVVRQRGRPDLRSSTRRRPLIGARDYQRARAEFPDRARQRGLGPSHVEHLLRRYGSLVWDLDELIAAQPRLAEPIAGAPRYLAVEAVYAASHEGALQLDDVLARRTHIAIETSDHGVSAAPVVAGLIAPVLGWDEKQVAAQVRWYRAHVEAEHAARQLPDDAAAVAASDVVRDPRLVVADKEVLD